MKDSIENTYTILEAKSGAAYDGLRALWSEVFEDKPENVDAFYKTFGDDITGYVLTDENGEVCAAITCHLCGEYRGLPVYVSYAICTRGDMRGRGMAGKLITFVRDKVTALGGISVLSPAEPSLIPYYERFGYEPHFSFAQRAVMSPEIDFCDYDDYDEFDLDIEGSEDTEPLRPAMDLQPLTPEKYNMYREAFLSGRPHIRPTEAMLRVMQAESLYGAGMYSVNRGDAICIMDEVGPAEAVLTELILNPVLHELSMDIDTEIASMIAESVGSVQTVFITPGDGGCQGMVYGLPPEDEPEPEDPYEASHNEEEFTAYTGEPYYGFPIP